MLVWGYCLSTVIPGTAVYHQLTVAPVWPPALHHRRHQQKQSSAARPGNHGRGWHNNHHHYMASARQGFLVGIDLTYYVLKVLSGCASSGTARASAHPLAPQPVPDRRVFPASIHGCKNIRHDVFCHAADFYAVQNLIHGGNDGRAEIPNASEFVGLSRCGTRSTARSRAAESGTPASASGEFHRSPNHPRDSGPLR